MQSIPQKRWCITVLPTRTTSVSDAGSAFPFLRRSPIIAPVCVRISAVRISCFFSLTANPTRLMTSAPCFAWALSAVATARTSAVRRSRSCATRVVVPTSIATPNPLRGANAKGDSSESIAASHWASSMVRSPPARQWHASRHPASSSFRESILSCSAVTGSVPSRTRTRQPLQRARPPQGNSTPYGKRTSCRGEPAGTSNAAPSGRSVMRTLSFMCRPSLRGSDHSNNPPRC